MPQDNETSRVTAVRGTDADMLAAMRRAREAFPDFLGALEADSRRIIPALSSALVKAYFADADSPEQGEHMWVTDVESDGQTITGTLCDAPSHVRSVRQGV